MPNRYIRDGWKSSDKIDLLQGNTAESFYLRLCLSVDDFGRFDGREVILKSALYPLKSEIRTADITRWLAECEKAGLLAMYYVEDKRYVEVLNFNQKIRIKNSKYPARVNENCPTGAGHMLDTCSTDVGHVPCQTPASNNAMSDRCHTDVGHMSTPITYDRRHITEDILQETGDKEEACTCSFKLANFSMLKKELHEKWKSYLLVYESTYKTPTVQAQDLILGDLLRVPEDKRLQALDNAIKGQWKNIYIPKDEAECSPKNRENVLTKLATSKELEEGF